MAKKNEEAVANPPAGGDQTQASTNDDNENTVLQTSPYLVVTYANRQVGVANRFPTRGEADNDAKARRVRFDEAGAGTKVKVMEEKDLPEFVAKVEAGEES